MAQYLDRRVGKKRGYAPQLFLVMLNRSGKSLDGFYLKVALDDSDGRPGGWIISTDSLVYEWPKGLSNGQKFSALSDFREALNRVCPKG